MDFIEILRAFFKNSQIEENHGIYHSIRVRDSVRRYINASPDALTPAHIKSLEYAALLHDVDDRKFFPNNKKLENAEMLLSSFEDADINIPLILRIIKLVSFSENGNEENLPEDDRWMYIVRYCDRLESIGELGILRSYSYSIFIDRPFFREDTPRPTTYEEVLKISRERYPLFLQRKCSNSMIDYFFDKLFIVSEDLSKNPNSYISQEAQRRKNILKNYLFHFSRTGDIQLLYISQLQKEYESDRTHSFLLDQQSPR